MKTKQHHPLFIGIDVGMRNLTVQAVDINSNALWEAKRTYMNTPVDVNVIGCQIAALALEHGFDRILIGFEATNNYGFHLPFAFCENKELAAFKPEIYQINPKLIKNFRKAYTGMQKTDYDDSFLIAERLKISGLKPLKNFDAQYFALRTLTRRRFTLIHCLAAEKTRFLSLLFIKSSGFAQNKLFSNSFGATSLSLNTFFNSVEDIALMPFEEMVMFICKKSKNHINNPEELAKTIAYVARGSYKIDKVLADSVNHVLMSYYSHIKFYTDEIKAIDKQILLQVEAFKNQFQILTSISGIGLVFASGIIAEIGDINNFEYQACLAKFSGLFWSIVESENYRSEEAHLVKSGNKYLRYYLTQASYSLTNFNPDFASYYKRKYNEALKHKHNRAIVLCARKLVRVVFSVLKQNKLYQLPSSALKTA